MSESDQDLHDPHDCADTDEDGTPVPVTIRRGALDEVRPRIIGGCIGALTRPSKAFGKWAKGFDEIQWLVSKFDKVIHHLDFGVCRSFDWRSVSHGQQPISRGKGVSERLEK